MPRGSSSFKKQKYEDLIKNEINSLFRVKFSDPGLKFISITKVVLTKDFEFAKIYWDTFDSNNVNSGAEAVKRVSGAVRSGIAKAISLRAVPKLTFIYDDQFESESKIDSILKDEADRGKNPN